MAERRRAEPVRRRSVLEDAATGWTAGQALDLLAQEYSVDRVVALTGFDHRWVRYQAARMTPADPAGDAPVDVDVDVGGGGGGR